MKGWKITKPLTLKECEISEQEKTTAESKVKITKVLLTFSDALRYTGDIAVEDVVLGSYGIGVVSETGANLFGLEKGKHVYIEPNRPCCKCYNCKNGEETKCSALMTAGEDFDGFLSDFVSSDSGKLFTLPESVSDFEALFIGHISLAISVVDKLNVQKGDYVAIVGANNFGIILAQLLIYYQAVPVVMTMDEEDFPIVKNSGIYYVLGPDDNWQKEITAITGGRMADSVVFISDCNIPINRAFNAASFNAKVAFTGVSYKNSSISFAPAIKKQLDIHCINSGFGNTATSINLLANGALNLTYLKLDAATYDQVPETFEKMKDKLDKDGKVYETIVDLI